MRRSLEGQCLQQQGSHVPRMLRGYDTPRLAYSKDSQLAHKHAFGMCLSLHWFRF
ncbi:hypothetical protein DPMN_146417 [Dreissena polymorpha]|uniref:Uncharacterized protein n=1 Tax=Dreissena polymorpha TaxID=45954 RepID=A0A9D4F7V2_DREPO|nr:hypothetical protein DPMN_146417 [Dreissena polymorpha]